MSNQAALDWMWTGKYNPCFSYHPDVWREDEDGSGHDELRPGRGGELERGPPHAPVYSAALGKEPRKQHEGKGFTKKDLHILQNVRLTQVTPLLAFGNFMLVKKKTK